MITWWRNRTPISPWLRLAWLLPDTLVYWCGIRMAAYASTERWPAKHVDDIGIMDMLDAWEKKDEND